MKRHMSISLIFIFIQALGAASADDVMSNAQAVEYVAFLTASGEVCASRYPGLQSVIDQAYKQFDGKTKDGVDRIRQTPEFAEALNKARAQKDVLEITEEQCKSIFQ